MEPIDAFLLEGRWYRPRMLPVDYGGDLVYRLSLVLEDGTYLERSTLQTAGEDGSGSEEAIRRALALLQNACETVLKEGGSLPAREFLWNNR